MIILNDINHTVIDVEAVVAANPGWTARAGAGNQVGILQVVAWVIDSKGLCYPVAVQSNHVAPGKVIAPGGDDDATTLVYWKP